MTGKQTIKAIVTTAIMGAVLCLLLIWIMGCTTFTVPSCVPRAGYAALSGAVDNGHTVRIVISSTAVEGVDHAEAVAFIGGKWKYGKVIGSDIAWEDYSDERALHPRYRPLKPYKRLTVPQLIDELEGKLK